MGDILSQEELDALLSQMQGIGSRCLLFLSPTQQTCCWLREKPRGRQGHALLDDSQPAPIRVRLMGKGFVSSKESGKSLQKPEKAIFSMISAPDINDLDAKGLKTTTRS